MTGLSPSPRRGGEARRRGRTAARGQSLLEFALVVPLLLLVIFSAIDFGRAVSIYNALANGARQGAHYAATNNVKSCAIGDGQNLCEAVRTAALAADPLVATSSVSLTVTYDPSVPSAISDPLNAPTTIRTWTVGISYTLHPIIGMVLRGLTLPISSNAEVIGQ